MSTLFEPVCSASYFRGQPVRKPHGEVLVIGADGILRSNGRGDPVDVYLARVHLGARGLAPEHMSVARQARALLASASAIVFIQRCRGLQLWLTRFLLGRDGAGNGAVG